MNKKTITGIIAVSTILGYFLAYTAYHHSDTAVRVTEGFKAYMSSKGYAESDDYIKGFENFSPLWWVYSGHRAVMVAPIALAEFVIPNPENIQEPDGLGNLQVLTTSPESMKAISDATTYFRKNGFVFEARQSNTLETKIAPQSIYSAAWYAPVSGTRCRFIIREPVHGIMDETRIPNFTGILACADSGAYKTSYKDQSPFVDAMADQDPDDFPEGTPYFFVLWSSESPYFGGGQSMRKVAIMDVLTNNSFGGVVERKGNSWVHVRGDIHPNQ